MSNYDKREVKFSSSDVELEREAENITLQEALLDLLDQPIDNEQVTKLLSNKQATELTFSSISTEQLRILVSILQRVELSQLRSLNFSDCVTHEGVKILMPLLSRPSLNILDLQINTIDNQGAKDLAKILAQNPPLNKLILGHNKIGDEGAINLAEALYNNHNLTVLDLSCNAIGQRGMEALAAVIRHNDTLKELYLLGNKYLGAKTIVDAVAVNPVLRKVQLPGPKGMDPLLDKRLNNYLNRNLKLAIHTKLAPHTALLPTYIQYHQSSITATIQAHTQLATALAELVQQYVGKEIIYQEILPKIIAPQPECKSKVSMQQYSASPSQRPRSRSHDNFFQAAVSASPILNEDEDEPIVVDVLGTATNP